MAILALVALIGLAFLVGLLAFGPKAPPPY
jgi:hypothetical protein